MAFSSHSVITLCKAARACSLPILRSCCLALCIASPSFYSDDRLVLSVSRPSHRHLLFYSQTNVLLLEVRRYLTRLLPPRISKRSCLLIVLGIQKQAIVQALPSCRCQIQIALFSCFVLSFSGCVHYSFSGPFLFVKIMSRVIRFFVLLLCAQLSRSWPTRSTGVQRHPQISGCQLDQVLLGEGLG
jgi:hypothetical protein